MIPRIVREEAASLTTSPSTWSLRLLALILLALLVLPIVVVIRKGTVRLKGRHQLHERLHLVANSQTGKTRLELCLPPGTHCQHGGVSGQQPKVQLRVIRLQVDHVLEGILVSMLHRVFCITEIRIFKFTKMLSIFIIIKIKITSLDKVL